MDEMKRDNIQEDLLSAVQQAEGSGNGASVPPVPPVQGQVPPVQGYQANFRPQAQPGYGQVPYQGQTFQNQAYEEPSSATPYNQQMAYEQQTTYGQQQTAYNQQNPYQQQPVYGQQTPYHQQMPYGQMNYNPYQGMMGQSGPVPGNGLSIASLICGISAVITCWIPILGLLLGIAGIITGVMAKKQQGFFNGMALTGFICGITGLALNVIIYTIAVIAIFLEDYYWYYY